MFSCAAEAGYRTIDIFALICKKEEKEKGKCESEAKKRRYGGNPLNRARMPF
jgi:hypothetical protein